MIHERLQAHVIREYRLRRLRHTTVPARGTCVCRRRVEFGEEETRLRTAGIADDKTWEREAVLDEFLYHDTD